MPRAGLTSRRVVEAAADIADAEGLGELTMARLAKELGVRVPSLYKHVDGLPDLHRRLAALSLAGMAEAIRSATIGRSGKDALRACCKTYRDYARRFPGRYLAGQRAPDPTAEADREINRHSEELVSLVLAVLRGYQLDGEESIHATRILRSAVHGFTSLESMGGFGLPTQIEESFDRLVDILDAGFRRMSKEDNP